VTDTDPNKQYIDARASLRDTAKWIVTILGATVVLVIGGGLIAKIADLDWEPRLVTAGCLLVLALMCMMPLKAAIDIVAAKLTPLGEMALSPDFTAARKIVNQWLEGHYPPAIDSVEKLYKEYRDQASIANDPARSQPDRDAASAVLGELQPRIREVIEVTNTENLRLKFDSLLRTALRSLPVVGIALFVFLISSHKDDATEKSLSKPVLLQIAWSAEIESELKKAGLPANCYLKDPPRLLQVSEKSGLRAGVLVIPHDLSDACPAVRVVVTSASKVYLSD
jgi:hypothetical protein